MKKILYIILISVLWGQFDNVGTSAANFLKINVGARGSALGGAYSAQVEDASALYWNPAGMGMIDKPEIQFNSTDWIFDVQHQFFAAVFPAGFGKLGLSISYLTMGEIKETTLADPDGTGRKITSSDLALSLGFARRVSDHFVFGIQGKYIRETISFSSASAIAMDAGSQYLTGFHGLKIGMSLSNFGSKMRLFGTDQLIDVDVDPDLGANPQVNGRLDTKDWPLPMVFRFGLSMQLLGEKGVVNPGPATAVLNVEYIDPRDFNPYYVIATEVAVMDLIFIRIGQTYQFLRFDESLADEAIYDALTTEKGYVPRLSWGVGLSSKNFPLIPYDLHVDYSVSDMGILNMVNRLTFTLVL
ncbi:MAG: PorV/PorQ family protein [Fidelibacterota bacterium]